MFEFLKLSDVKCLFVFLLGSSLRVMMHTHLERELGKKKVLVGQLSTRDNHKKLLSRLACLSVRNLQIKKHYINFATSQNLKFIEVFLPTDP